MRCDECLGLLDQYVEGELDEQTTRSLTAHVTTCPGCASSSEALRHEQEIYASYFLDVEASPDLWETLQSKIEEEKTLDKHNPLTRLKWWVTNALAAPHLSLARVAALVVIIAGLTIGVMRYMRSDDADHVRRSAVSVIGVTPSPGERDVSKTGGESNADADIKTRGVGSSSAERRAIGRNPTLTVRKDARRSERLAGASAADHPPLPGDVLRQAERQYLTDINFLSHVAKRRLRQSSPMALARLKETLTAIDQTIAETRLHVSQNPSDPVAVQRMMAAYSRKVELLRATVNT